MGMTIDEIIKGIQIIKAQAEWDYPLDWQIVLDGAIDIMRKYQKLEQEPTSKSEALVSLDVYKQVAWERDIAIQQLHELGYEFGQKIEPTKNDSGVDCISRVDAIKAMQDKAKKLKNEDTINGLCGAVAILFDMPSVTPQEPQTFKWCTNCKEYDQEKHCCHRWSKVIRNTVEEMKQEQELNPMVEIDLDYVIKQKYIERDVLDKIRAEILEEKECAYADFERYKVEYLGQDWEDALDSLPQDDFRYGMERAIELIDKYKAENEKK